MRRRSLRAEKQLGSAVLSILFVTSLLVFGVSAGVSGAADHVLASTSLSANGEWPGVGKICETGTGGSSTVRGVGPKSLNIAVFNDASNTVEPGLEKEFVQFANAFASWCNAAGGINGRHIVIHNRDAALFNAAQVANESCQSDFMAVGGGMALDQASVPVRVGCGLGEITGYVVSDQSQTAPLQVDTLAFNPNYVAAGFFAQLAKKYPSAVKKAAMGSQNVPQTVAEMRKIADAATVLGWQDQEFQIAPYATSDWTPYVQQLQSKGIEAVWPSDDINITPYLRAMSTQSFKPAFLLLGSQFYNSQTISGLQGLGPLPPIYIESQWWPLEMASQNPSTEQLIQVMHKYAKGDSVDFDDEDAATSWLLWAKAASACGASLTVSCVLNNATVKNWSAGGIAAPIAQLKLSNQGPVPSPCTLVLQAKASGFSYDKAVTQPTQSIWNCNPKNVVHLSAQQLAAIGG